MSLGLGLGLLVTGLLFRGGAEMPASQVAAIPQILGTGLALCGAALLAVVGRRRWNVLLAPGEPAPGEPAAGGPAAVAGRGFATLFLASFAALFLELTLIRYCGSQIRIFAFYKNVPLVSCFLGLGLGCCLGRGRGRHAISFLLWLIPLAAFLAQGALPIDRYLAVWDAATNTEHVLGAGYVAQPDAAGALVRQLSMGGFCAVMLVAIGSLFVLLGRLLGAAFEGVPRLAGYTVNILGSLAGILAFVAMSYLRTPPWLWFIVGLSPLLWWVSGRARTCLALALISFSTLLVMPSYGDTVWSSYQKLVGHRIPASETGTESPAYLVEISDVFYQVAIDLRPEAWASSGRHPFPHYDWVYEQIPQPHRVLVVGAGTGNDVAAALRAGADHVDAVDIDPAIVAMGRRHHPEAPYSDRRVTVLIEDARAAFRRLPAASYDAVVFGLLDSHSQLGISSVRLDNYVFTLESFRSARRLLKPGGHLVVTAATFRRWFADRLTGMLEATCDGGIVGSMFGASFSYVCRIEDPEGRATAARSQVGELPTDDWPFLYLPERGVPGSYLVVLGMLALASVAMLRGAGLGLSRFTAYHGHMFFLGAAFLLMEVYAINRLALLFGSTWLVSAVTIALVLILIVAGNVTVALVGAPPYAVVYAALLSSLAASFFLEPAGVLGLGLAWSLAYGLFLLMPIFFAALVFARSFRVAKRAGAAIGVNILGSVLGGWAEYTTMATGIRSMVLLAAVFYLLSCLALLRSRVAQDGPG